MRRNNICGKRSTLIVVFFVILISLLVYISKLPDLNEKRLLNQLKQNVNNEEVIDKDLLDKVCTNIYVKEFSKDIETAEEYYFLACKSRSDKDADNSKNNILKAYSLINDETDTFVKLSTYTIINSEFQTEVSNEEQVDIFKNIFKSLTAEDMNDNISIIKNYINIMSIRIDDKSILIDVLSYISSQSYKLDSSLSYYVRDCLAVENINQGKYAQAIEASLQSLWENEKNPDPYYEARALINTGVVYYDLNDYDTALKYMEESLEVYIPHEEKNIHAKLYALVNIYLIYYDKEDYDSMFRNFELIEQYVNEDSVNIFKIYEQIAYAQFYLKIDDLEKAEEYINSTNHLYELYGNDIVYNDSSVHNSMNISELNYKKGNIDDSISVYEKLLADSDNKYGSKKKILQNLVNIYTEINDDKNTIKYLNMLKDTYENESVIINANYSNNLVEMRKYEKIMKDILEKKNLLKIITSIFLFVIASIIIHFYSTNVKLKKINKIDGLTKIYNRRYFNEMYEKILNEDTSFNIIIFDIDNFKTINDTYGHVFGDKIIAGTVSSIKNILDKKDKLFRYGGEEFVIISYSDDKEYISDLCEKIRKTIEMLKWEIDINATISIGACSRRDGGTNVL